MKTANIQEFHEKFVKEYDFLYDNYDNVAGSLYPQLIN